MFVDTHCHINIMVKEKFDVPLTQTELTQAHEVLTQAAQHTVTTIINVGTSVVESNNCIAIAACSPHAYAVVGVHPNDLTDNWRADINAIKEMIKQKQQHRIVGIGECGFDFHYKDYCKQRQYDAFKEQIEIALEHDLALVVHSRDAYDETLALLEEFKTDITRGVMHCFSYDLAFAQQVIEWDFFLGIGGTITYPKNNGLRNIVQTVPLEKIVLETDAPFLPPQIIRGKKNHPRYIVTIAEFIAQLNNIPLSTIARTTTANAHALFGIQETV